MDKDWSEPIKKRLKEKAQECKELSEAHEEEAHLCNRSHRRITITIRIIGVIFTILQIVAFAIADNRLALTIPIISLTSMHFILTEISNHYQYKTREKENIKVSIDYRILYTNIILTSSEDYNLEIPKSAYAEYVFNTFNRIKTNSPYLRTKLRNSIKLTNPVILIEQNNNVKKRSTSLEINEEIKNRLADTNINSINQWEAHRLIFNL